MQKEPKTVILNCKFVTQPNEELPDSDSEKLPEVFSNYFISKIQNI